MTLTEALTEYTAAFKRDTSDVDDATWIYWGDYINKEFRRTLEGVDPERYVSTQSYTVSTSPSSQALPATFRTVSTFGCGLYYLNSDSTPRGDKLSMTGYGYLRAGYFISGSNVTFTGINSSTPFLMRFMPTITTLAAMSDSLEVPAEYNLYIMKAFDEIYEQWDEDATLESLADFRLTRTLSELTKTIPRQPTVYALMPHN